MRNINNNPHTILNGYIEWYKTQKNQYERKNVISLKEQHLDSLIEKIKKEKTETKTIDLTKICYFYTQENKTDSNDFLVRCLRGALYDIFKIPEPAWETGRHSGLKNYAKIKQKEKQLAQAIDYYLLEKDLPVLKEYIFRGVLQTMHDDMPDKICSIIEEYIDCQWEWNSKTDQGNRIFSIGQQILWSQEGTLTNINTAELKMLRQASQIHYSVAALLEKSDINTIFNILNHPKIMNFIIGQEPARFSSILKQIKKYILNEPKLYYALLSALVVNYTTIRKSGGAGDYIPYVNAERSKSAKIAASMALSNFISEANSLLHDEDANIDEQLFKLKLEPQHKAAFKSGKLETLYLAFLSAINFTAPKLNVALARIMTVRELSPIIIRYIVSRAAKASEYTSRGGSLNPWTFSQPQKLAATQLIWQCAEKKIDINKLKATLKQKKLTRAAQQGDVRLIYEKLQELTAPCEISLSTFRNLC